MTQKTCTQCKTTKPLHAFGRNRSAVDGLHYYCRECAAERQRAWATANAEKLKHKRKVYLQRIHALNEARDPYAP